MLFLCFVSCYYGFVLKFYAVARTYLAHKLNTMGDFIKLGKKAGTSREAGPESRIGGRSGARSAEADLPRSIISFYQ